MNIKSAKSIIFSPCGGSLKVARAVTKGIAFNATEYNLTLPGQRQQSLNFESDDLAVFSFPVYGGHVPRVISKNIFKILNGHKTPALLIAVYGNREFEGALLDLCNLAVARGFRPVAAVAAVAEHTIAPEIAANRPDHEDLALLENFGGQIYERLAAQPDLESFSFLAPGVAPNHPPSEPMRPEADPEVCTECGQCPPVCPVSAIPEETPMVTDTECICCMACVKICPEKARALNDARVPSLLDWLKKTAGERKNPRLFL